MNFGVSATATGNFYTNDGGSTGNSDLDTVLNSHVYSSNSWSFSLGGLNPGTEYQIQIVGAGDTRGCCSGRNQRAGDGGSPENFSGDFSRSGVGSVIGTFTADGVSQEITINNGNTNGTDPGISAYILREASPAIPLAPTDISLSVSDLPPNMPSGSIVGVIGTTDPNSGDTHTYTLVDSGSFPDNALFAIGSESRLETAATLGGFGSTYQIKLRTTDSGGLFFEKTFALNVEAASAPTTLGFGATTVLRTTPIGGAVGVFSTVDANAADSHSYALVSGAGDTDNALFSISGDTLLVSADLPGLGSALSLRVRSTDLSGLSVENTVSLTVVDTSVRVNEFLANNSSTSLMDEDGDTPDWIELHNPDGGTVNLDGWYLTDDPANLTKWQLPAISISGGEYLVVFASSKDRKPVDGGNLHTNFALASRGDYIALVAADGSTIISAFAGGGADYPPQRNGVTYGFYGDPLDVGYMLNPTPGAENDGSSGVLGFVADTKFSVDRGFYDTPFELSITTATPGATIRYTTDGSWPSATVGTIYDSPITVDRAMPVKAIAYQEGFEPTNVDTHTYVFVDSVLEQTDANTRSVYGLPNFSQKYYGMNNNPSVNPGTHPTIAADLTTVPSLSIALDADDMFGGDGIYTNPQSSGSAWERRTSLEIIDPADPAGSGNFQQNCAIRIQGGAFRSFGLTRKKSFRVLFKSQFGTQNQPTGGSGTMQFPLFGTAPGVAQEFQTLVFRMESNDGWQWSGAGDQPQYARDEFGRRAQLALGQPASHGRYMHLYINGVYWGLYNIVERPDSGFAESYIEGADRDLWEGQNSGSAINDATNLNTWNSYRSAVAPISAASTDTQRDRIFLEACGFDSDGTRNPTFPIWCDPSNTADYFIVNWYGGNSDWPNKNYYGGIDRQESRTGYKYFMWDSEWSLFLRSGTNYDRIDDYRGIADPNDDLEESPEYRVRFGDRAHRALFNDGPFTPENARALYEEVTAQHTSILVPEAARWGNQHGGQRDVGDWQGEYNNILNNWFPVRTGRFLDSLRDAELYPAIDAPIYSQHGGSVPAGGGPAFITPTSVSRIYYQFGTDGPDPSQFSHPLDPRLVGGEIHPAATLVTMDGGGGAATTFFLRTGDEWSYLDDGSNQGAAWRISGFNDDSWATGPSQLGYGDDDEAETTGFIDTDPGPGEIQKNATTYFRTTIDIADPSVFENFTLDYVYDDAIAIYINGTEVARHNLSSNAPFDEYANDSDGDDAAGSRTLSPFTFSAGTNTIAAEIHQDSPESSDISFDLTLRGNPVGGSDTHTSEPVALTEPGWLYSRSYDANTGEWSALNTAFFSIGSVAADAGNLVISEFNYHPAEPVTPAETAVSIDRDDYEFIELMNVAAQAIDLTGVRFAAGITFDFAENTLLPPGGRLVLVKNKLAFETRYPDKLGSVVFASDTSGSSEYGGRLDNDGEQLSLLDSLGGAIRDFTFNDKLPWPPSADGAGFSLVLKAPSIPIPDHALPESWVANAVHGGCPGAADTYGFIGDPDADSDNDGTSAFLEYALGTSDLIPSQPTFGIGSASFESDGTTADYLTMEFTRNLHAQNAVTITPQISTDLVGWNGPPDLLFVSQTDNSDGTATVIYRSASPIGAKQREFVRLHASE